jgi:LysR family transcriptional regulator, regulator for bpeEF and oprC
MDRFTALQIFVRVVESGSFSQAAREFGVGQPAVSKQIAALERRLGVQLLNRTSRGLRPTPSGLDLYQSGTRLLDDLDIAESRVADSHGRPSGTVRLAAPPMLTTLMIVPKLPGFFADFPDVKLEFAVSARLADLVQDDIDLAIRVGQLDDSGLVARRVGSMRNVTVASAAYLGAQGIPMRPNDLSGHRLVAHRSQGAVTAWRFRDGEGHMSVPVTAQFSCDNPTDLHAAVLAGLGICQAARGLFEAELQSGEVAEVLGDFAPEAAPIHLVYANGRLPKRVRAVSEFVTRCISEQPSVRLD